MEYRITIRETDKVHSHRFRSRSCVALVDWFGRALCDNNKAWVFSWLLYNWHGIQAPAPPVLSPFFYVYHLIMSSQICYVSLSSNHIKRWLTTGCVCVQAWLFFLYVTSGIFRNCRWSRDNFVCFGFCLIVWNFFFWKFWFRIELLGKRHLPWHRVS